MRLKFTVGISNGATLIAKDCEALPPAPEHVSTNIVVPVRFVRVSFPMVALLPVQPFEARHEVALVLVQVKVLVPLVPFVDSATGVAVIVTVGTGVGGGATVTVMDFGKLVPPTPVHAME